MKRIGHGGEVNLWLAADPLVEVPDLGRMIPWTSTMRPPADQDTPEVKWI